MGVILCLSINRLNAGGLGRKVGLPLGLIGHSKGILGLVIIESPVSLGTMRVSMRGVRLRGIRG